MEPTRKRQLLLWVGMPVLVILVGMLTYLLGGPGAKQETETDTADTPTLALSTADPQITFAPRELFALTWGDDGVAVAGEPQASTLEAVFEGTSGHTFVVDHPEWHIGARVRRYDDRTGEVVAEHLAPSGSLFFTAEGEGFKYVIAKQSKPYETAVVVDGEGSIEATYAIPLELNSGGLTSSGGTLYAEGESTTLDPDTGYVERISVLVPVAVDGVQVDDATAGAQIFAAWRPSGLDAFLTREIFFDPSEEAEDESGQLLGLTNRDAPLEIPAEAAPMGIDADGRVWIVIDARPIDANLDRPVAGWPARAQASRKIVVGSWEGEALADLQLPVSTWVQDARQLATLGPNGLTAAIAGYDGVRIVRYEEAR